MPQIKNVYYTFAEFSKDQSIFDINGRFGAEMLNTILVVVTEVVESQTVCFGICDLLEFEFEFTCLGIIYNAFKYGVLHTYPVIYALLCDLPEPLLPAGSFRAHIICY